MVSLINFAVSESTRIIKSEVTNEVLNRIEKVMMFNPEYTRKEILSNLITIFGSVVYHIFVYYLHCITANKKLHESQGVYLN